MQEENGKGPMPDHEMMALTMKQAIQIEKAYNEIKRMYPTSYMQKMQPYINTIIGYKKKTKCKNNVEAAIVLSSARGLNDHQRVMYLATAAQMTLNDGTK